MADVIANPYIGPRAFTYAQRDRFFGRDAESRDLLSLVISERLVLFYAQSGAGKSSLINTQLIPELKEEAGYAVLPVTHVGGELPDGVSAVDNIFVFNLLLLLDQRRGDPHRFAHMTLKDFLARLTSPDGELYYYDDGAMPAEDTNTYEESPYVLIIDQFEEIITTHLERWQERTTFFRQLDAAMTADPLLRVVLTLREDYVAALDPYTRLLSDRLRARFYMQRMGYEAALEAVCQPAKKYGRPFAPDVAETLVDNLRQIRVGEPTITSPGQFVEPVQLQVVCYQLWENLKDQDTAEITAQDLQQLGDVDRALASFYQEAITNALRDERVSGLSEMAVRKWFDQRLITEAGTRGMVYQGETHTAELPNLVVQLLEDRHILKSEIRSGRIWYELVHDRLVEPVQNNNIAWFDANLSLLQRQANLWAAKERPTGLILQGGALSEAEHWATNHRQELLPIDEEFLSACLQARRIRWLEKGFQLSLLILLLIVGYTAYTLRLKSLPWAYFIDFSNSTTHYVSSSLVSLGRSTDRVENTIDIQNKCVSRIHLQVFKDNSTAVDMRSKNGSTVNTKFLPYDKAIELKNDSIVVLGGVAPFQFKRLKYWPLQFWTPRVAPPQYVSQSDWAMLVTGSSRVPLFLKGFRYFLALDDGGRIELGESQTDRSFLLIERIMQGRSIR